LQSSACFVGRYHYLSWLTGRGIPSAPVNMLPHMKKLPALLFTASLFSLASTAGAEVYLRGSALFTSPDDLTASESFSAAVENSVGYSLALGYKFSIARIEAEGMMIDSSIDGVSGDPDFEWAEGDLKYANLFVNAYIDIPGIPLVTPYVGAGVGLGWIDMDGNFELTDTSQINYENRSTLPAYQLILGVRARIPATEVSVFANYRFIHMNGMRAASDVSGAPSLETGDVSAWEIGVQIAL